MNRKLAPHMAASDSNRNKSTGFTARSRLDRDESVAERLIDGNRKTGIELNDATAEKLGFSCTRFTG
ncbi:TPA: hypothetical protein SAN82_005262 [Pseudomonas putida]|nr:hypothetical protein [Pseudomonas putida]